MCCTEFVYDEVRYDTCIRLVTCTVYSLSQIISHPNSLFGYPDLDSKFLNMQYSGYLDIQINRIRIIMFLRFLAQYPLLYLGIIIKPEYDEETENRDIWDMYGVG